MRRALGLLIVLTVSTAGSALAQGTPANTEEPRRIPFPAETPQPRTLRPAPAPPEGRPSNVPPVRTWDPVFDPALDVAKAIESARASAAREHRRVLIIWGMNTGDAGWMSARLKGVFREQVAGDVLRDEYDVVWALASEGDKSAATGELAQRFRADLSKGLPALTVIDPRGRVIANTPAKKFENENPWDPDYISPAVGAFLRDHQADRVDVGVLMEDTLAKAKAEGKPVFLRYTSREDPWSDRLDAWAWGPAAELLARHFVVEKIDIGRSAGGFERFAKVAGMDASTPWFEFLAPGGSTLTTSVAPGPTGNIGFPSSDAELEALAGMLRTARPEIPAGDVAAIAETLRAARPASVSPAR
jgi:hypothetical protein